jgi:hypothetical protein
MVFIEKICSGSRKVTWPVDILRKWVNIDVRNLTMSWPVVRIVNKHYCFHCFSHIIVIY